MNEILIILCASELIIMGVLVLYCGILSKQIKGLKFQCKSSEQEMNEWQKKLLEKVKERIVLTETTELGIKKVEDLVIQFSYQQEDIKQLKEELFNIFNAQITKLSAQFPQLTDLDLLVICLLGIGMDNVEIAALLRMEKRTLYRRRQLIGQRIGISSTQLDELSTTLFA